MDQANEAHELTRPPWWRGTRGEYYVIVQGVIFALIALGPRNWPGAPAWPAEWDAVATIVGVTLMLIGMPLAVAGLLALGDKSLTALPYPKDGSVLVESGPYALVRHPIYAGLILGAFGWGLFVHGGLTLLYAAALFLLFDLKSRREERWLSERYTGYAEYRTRVKKLLPWIY